MRFPIILALAVGSTALDQPAYAQSVEPPRISVVGTGTVKTAPDVAVINYSVRGEGQTSDAAVGALVARRNRIEAGLATFGAKVEVRTGRMAITEVRGKDCPQYGPARLSVGECTVLGFVAELPTTLRTADVSRAGTMVGLIGRLEGTSPSLSDFSLADPKLAQRRAIAGALADAREKADAIAGGTSRHLGRLLAASYGNMNADSANDIVVTARRVESPVMVIPPIAVDLNPQPIETQAQVTVMYEIAP